MYFLPMQKPVRPAAPLILRLAVLVGTAGLIAACSDEDPATADAGRDGPGGEVSFDAGAGERPVYASFESQYCSAIPGDDPLYVCAGPLVCVNTFDEVVPSPDGGASGGVPVYLCRVPCAVTAPCSGGDICCPGRTADGKAVEACVPESRCELVRDR